MSEREREGVKGGGIPWSEVLYRNNRRRREGEVAVTFLIQNLPETVSRTLF
ncbi:hypothetical protein Hanom_Chr14g01272481 [Helianthus anomalus]